ncbi:unnamed protein product [Ectocarpus sp. 4 AP-2014]
MFHTKRPLCSQSPFPVPPSFSLCKSVPLSSRVSPIPFLSLSPLCLCRSPSLHVSPANRTVHALRRERQPTSSSIHHLICQTAFVRFRRELAALQARLTTLGYQDGVDDGVQESVQEGFDQGYAVGAAAGWEVGSLYGAAAAAEAALKQAARGGKSTEKDAGTVGGLRFETAAGSSTSGALSAASLGSTGAGEIAGGGGGSSSSGGAVSQPVESDRNTKTSLAVGTAEDLQRLVGELRRASLLGPDGPGVPDRAEVLRRLRLVGPAGVAVADGLDK